MAFKKRVIRTEKVVYPEICIRTSKHGELILRAYNHDSFLISLCPSLREGRTDLFIKGDDIRELVKFVEEQKDA